MCWHLCIFSPVEFRYNQVQTTRLEYCSLPGETLISWFRCVFIGVEAKLWRTRALQDRVWMPRSKPTAKLNPYFTRKRFSQACAKSEVQCCTWNLGTYKNCDRHAVVCFSRRLAQSVEHETLNLRVVGSSPTLGLSFGFLSLPNGLSVSSPSLDLSLLMQDMCGMHSVGILPLHSRGLYVVGLCGAIG